MKPGIVYRKPFPKVADSISQGESNHPDDFCRWQNLPFITATCPTDELSFGESKTMLFFS
jgi:hypothetical protein